MALDQRFRRQRQSDRVQAALQALVAPSRVPQCTWRQGEHELVFQLLPPYERVVRNSEVHHKFRACFDLLLAHFKKNVEALTTAVYAGRSPKNPTLLKGEDTRHAVHLTSGLWLDGQLVCAACFRVNWSLAAVPGSTAGRTAVQDAPHVQILFIATATQHQRRGLGTLLTTCVLQRAALAGHQAASVVVGGPHVERYWRRLGFVADAQQLAALEAKPHGAAAADGCTAAGDSRGDTTDDALCTMYRRVIDAGIDFCMQCNVWVSAVAQCSDAAFAKVAKAVQNTWDKLVAAGGCGPSQGPPASQPLQQQLPPSHGLGHVQQEGGNRRARARPQKVSILPCFAVTAVAATTLVVGAGAPPCRVNLAAVHAPLSADAPPPVACQAGDDGRSSMQQAAPLPPAQQRDPSPSRSPSPEQQPCSSPNPGSVCPAAEPLLGADEEPPVRRKRRFEDGCAGGGCVTGPEDVAPPQHSHKRARRLGRRASTVSFGDVPLAALAAFLLPDALGDQGREEECRPPLECSKDQTSMLTSTPAGPGSGGRSSLGVAQHEAESPCCVLDSFAPPPPAHCQRVPDRAMEAAAPTSDESTPVVPKIEMRDDDEDAPGRPAGCAEGEDTAAARPAGWKAPWGSGGHLQTAAAPCTEATSNSQLRPPQEQSRQQQWMCEGCIIRGVGMVPSADHKAEASSHHAASISACPQAAQAHTVVVEARLTHDMAEPKALVMATAAAGMQRVSEQHVDQATVQALQAQLVEAEQLLAAERRARQAHAERLAKEVQEMLQVAEAAARQLVLDWEASQADTATLQAQLASAEQLLAACRKGTQADKEALQAQLAATLQQLDEEGRAKQANAERLANDADALRAQLQQRDAQLRDSAAQLAATQKERQAINAVLELKDKDVGILSVQLQQRNAQLRAAQEERQARDADMARKDKDVGILSVQLQQRNAQLQAAQEERQARDADMARMAKDADAIKADLQQRNAQLQAAKEERQARDADMARMAKDADAIKAQLQQRNAQLQAAQEEWQARDADVERLGKDAGTLRDQLQERDVQLRDSATQLAVAQEERQAGAADVERLCKVTAALRARLQQRDAQLRDSTKQLAAAQQERQARARDADMERLGKDADALRAQLQQCDVQLRDSAAQLAAAQEERQARDADVARLAKDADAIRAQLQDCATQLAAGQEELQAAKAASDVQAAALQVELVAQQALWHQQVAEAFDQCQQQQAQPVTAAVAAAQRARGEAHTAELAAAAGSLRAQVAQAEESTAHLAEVQVQLAAAQAHAERQDTTSRALQAKLNGAWEQRARAREGQADTSSRQLVTLPRAAVQLLAQIPALAEQAEAMSCDVLLRLSTANAQAACVAVHGGSENTQLQVQGDALEHGLVRLPVQHAMEQKANHERAKDHNGAAVVANQVQTQQPGQEAGPHAHAPMPSRAEVPVSSWFITLGRDSQGRLDTARAAPERGSAANGGSKIAGGTIGNADGCSS